MTTSLTLSLETKRKIAYRRFNTMSLFYIFIIKIGKVRECLNLRVKYIENELLKTEN